MCKREIGARATYRFTLPFSATLDVSMKVYEIVGAAEPKPKKSPQRKSDFEKNASKLRSKERELNAKSPVSPIKHRP